MQIDEKQKFSIIIADDSHAEIELLRVVCSNLNLIDEIHTVYNGQELLDFLKHTSNNRNNLPDLVLLDLNMPRMSGKEALKAIKSDNDLAHIPVIIMSSSSRKEDIFECYRNHCNSYIIKPMRLDEFQEIISQIQKFWFTCAVLPTKDRGNFYEKI